MAKNITLLGANYPDVPAVVLPQTGGGTARFVDADMSNVSVTVNTTYIGSYELRCRKVLDSFLILTGYFRITTATGTTSQLITLGESTSVDTYFPATNITNGKALSLYKTSGDGKIQCNGSLQIGTHIVNCVLPLR